ncbi:hypothetical protein BH10ACT9_BH10ACT9_34220 [soil metagenome]
MIQRLSVWLMAGVVTVGMSTALLAGASVAFAEPDQGAEPGAASETSKPETSKPELPTKRDRPTSRGPAADDDSAAPDEPAETEAAENKGAENKSDDSEADETEPAVAEHDDEAAPAERSSKRPEDRSAARSAKADAIESIAAESTAVEPEKADAVSEPEPEVSTEQTPPPDQLTQVVPVPSVDAVTDPAVMQKSDVEDLVERSATRAVGTALAFAAPDATPSGPTLVNIIGTAVFAVFDLVTKILEGPPAVPAGSSVTVGRSTLEIDCGDGYTTDADWFFPDTDEPAGIIYFQHGGFARAGFYNVTAAELAERTNSIVVAPSVTGNLFACDSCHTGGDQMHFAVAKLFSGDRAALQASADAAAGHPVALPRRYILSGHSAGGQLVAGAGGYAAQIAEATGQPLELAGVLLMDTSETGGAVSRGLAKIPLDVPVLYIAAEPAALDDFGSVEGVLNQLRGDRFQGVRIIGGVHNDAFQSSNPIVQIGGSLVFGFSQPQNVEALQVLAQGWIADMYAGTVYDENSRTGIYGDNGSTIDIPTDTGAPAHGYVLPAPPHQFNFFDSLQKALLDSSVALKFGYCAADIDAELEQMRQSSSAGAVIRRGFGCV